MYKSVAMLSGAVLALLLSAGPSLAGVGPSPTTTTLTASKTSITTSESVTLTTQVTNMAGATCTGMVTIQPTPAPSAVTCGIPVVGLAGSSDGTCTVSGSAFGTGVHTLVASYAGDSACLASSSGTLSLTVVNPAAVPTTSEWTLWGLTGLLLIGGGMFASRRFRKMAV